MRYTFSAVYALFVVPVDAVALVVFIITWVPNLRGKSFRTSGKPASWLTIDYTSSN